MIVALQRQGLNPTAIAKAIKRHRSTIYREFKKNISWHQDGSYHPIKAQRITRTRLRRKRYKAYDSRCRLAGKRNIADRPMEIKTRKTQGHSEIDTVMGKSSKHCIVTLV